MALLDHGGQFQQPPANAPREVTSDVVVRPGERELASQRQAAVDRAVERGIAPPPLESAELAPLAPPKLTREQIHALIGKWPEEVDTGEKTRPSVSPVAAPTTSSVKPVSPAPFVSKLRRVSRPAVDVGRPTLVQEPTIILTDAQQPDVSAEAAAALATLAAIADTAATIAEPQAHQPAASNSDTPSRGQPTFITDPGKKITGGFGVPGEGPADYIPLDGVEVRQVVERLLDEIRARAQDDLRFSIACSYPRVSVRVDVTIEAHGYDKPIVIPRVAVPVNRTSLETARLHADEICFIVTAARREFDDAGESETPPNRMRMELGVEIPRKQRIKTPSGGSMWVDRVGENRS